ncbi:hypothetical protein M1M11_08160 [Pseudomonas azerbaijanoccidens]|uniref:hypothetical protein n=1 Tax=Pseudomonas azerbaijanoccidentalis TaxID=2842347 RepID=UPI002009F14C|nr:hypothetical protein [Pseudomonas azerbaijanoccidentalis]MCK8664856.1 hypothetical protein [Pseudomonas azerbaijanoccidentalis]
MILRLVAISLMAASMGGCSGKIVNYMDARQGCDKGVCDGIFYYRLTQHTTKYYQDKIVDKDGNVLRFSGGSGDKSCVPVEITEVKLVPEEHPSLITYKPGIFEDSKFNVGLGASGNITSVGVDATSGAKAAIEAVSTIASTAKVLKTDANILAGKQPPQWVSPTDQPVAGAPYCNAGRIPVAVFKKKDSPPPQKNQPPSGPDCSMGVNGEVCTK